MTTIRDRAGGAPAAAPGFDIDAEVARRYANGAGAPEAELCCPISGGYDPEFLRAIPQEVLDVDYGCGDPSKHARAGERVLDLGSGSGKACFMIAQRVGASGEVLGVDVNDAMLAVARRNAPIVAGRVGFANTRFLKARIDDLRLDQEQLDAWLSRNPIRSAAELAAFEAHCDRVRRSAPLIVDASVDLVVSNCVLNLVRPQLKTQMFRELHRVLRRGGRAVISDIVCDEDPTPAILADPKLWSGCISGAYREDRFLAAFEEAGFYGVELLERSERPWRTIDGIEFRSVTVRAHKGKEGPCLERNQAVVYRGPWREVQDDDGHTYARGERMAVCDKTFGLLTDPSGPYAGDLIGIAPRAEVPLDEAPPFACRGAARRSARVSKGEDYRATLEAPPSCDGPSCC